MKYKALRRLRVRMLVVVLVCGGGAAAADPVTLLMLERGVTASATSGAPDADAVVSTATGPFTHDVNAYSGQTVCLPFGGKCVTYSARGTASQSSLVSVREDGTFEVRAHGSATASVSFSGEARAASRLLAAFAVDSEVDFVLQASGTGAAFAMLEDDQGRVIGAGDLTTGVERSGQLAPGTYTLRLAAEAVVATPADYRLAADLDVRLSVAGRRPDAVSCRVRLERPDYIAGERVVTTLTRIANNGAQAVPVELKMWLGLPGGVRLVARNDGADGSVVIPPAAGMDFAPFEVLAVDAQTAPGLYELGCRLLDPVSGRELAGDSDLFEVR